MKCLRDSGSDWDRAAGVVEQLLADYEDLLAPVTMIELVKAAALLRYYAKRYGA